MNLFGTHCSDKYHAFVKWVRTKVRNIKQMLGRKKVCANCIHYSGTCPKVSNMFEHLFELVDPDPSIAYTFRVEKEQSQEFGCGYWERKPKESYDKNT